MTDFAQDPLWEEEAQEPEKRPAPPDPKQEPQADPKAALAAAGNATAARTMAQDKPAPKSLPTPPPPAPAEKQPVAAAELMPEPPAPAPPKPVAEQLEPEAKRPVEEPRKAPDNWKRPLRKLISTLDIRDPADTLPPLLDLAADIPKALMPQIAAQIVSAFMRLPTGLRKPKRDALVAVLKERSELPLARLILTKLGGLPVAAPPPPPPTADT